MKTQIVDRPLSPSITDALGDWIHLSVNSSPHWAIIRDFDGLPEYCGFDLDVLVDNAEHTNVALAAVSTGRKHGLISYQSIKSARSAKVVWLNPKHDTKYRQWLVLDICTQIIIGHHIIKLQTLDTASWSNGGISFHVPTEPWRQTLHSLRNLARHQPVCLSELNLNQKCLGSFISNDSIKELSELSKTLNHAEQTSVLRGWLSKNGFAPKVPERKRSFGIFRKKLSVWIFFNLFFWHRHHPPFIAVTGADGVGKTTLINRLVTTLAQYPLLVSHYHHLADTKPKPQLPSDLSNNRSRVSLIRQILSGVWRYLLPHFAKNSFVGLFGEVRYAKQLNSLLGRSFFTDELCILDRYTFDRLVRLEMDARAVLQQWAGKFNYRFVRPPRLTLLLTDKPENILSRKGQLGLEGIKRYERRLRELVASTRIPLVEIHVEGKSPHEIEIEVMPFLLNAIGHDLPHLVSAWEKAFRNNSAPKT